MKFLFWLLAITTIINIVIYLKRDAFQFVPDKTYNELYKECDNNCIDKWRQFPLSYSPNELQVADSILQSLGINKLRSSLPKAQFIGEVLYSNFNDQVSQPSFKFSNATPLQQFQILKSKKDEQLWCGTFAQMFSFFCWSQNITCRNIEIMRPGDHHVVNECYIPELKQWVLFDITHGFVQFNQDKIILNLQSFITNLESGKPLQILKVDSSGILSKNVRPNYPDISRYYNSHYPTYYYYLTNLNQVYNNKSKLKRYLLPHSWYEIYSVNKNYNLLFHIKQILFILWITLIIIVPIKYYKTK